MRGHVRRGAGSQAIIKLYLAGELAEWLKAAVC